MTHHFIAHKGHQLKQPYRYDGCGLDNIYLLSGYEIVEDEEDTDGVIIHNLDALHKSIALRLVREEKILSGKEIRFLRIYMDLSQSELGKRLGCDSQMVARYEKEQNHIPSPTDRLLRLIVLSNILGTIDGQAFVKQIEEMESRKSQKFRFIATKQGWKATA